MMYNNVNSRISVLRMTSNSGKEEGNKLIYVNNGVLAFYLDESHGLDILSLRHKGTLVSLLTNNGLNNHGKGFLDSFPGGMLYTCGPDVIGNKSGYYQHGQYHLNPAEIIALEHNENTFLIRGSINVTSLFGVNFSFIREISTSYNSNSIFVKDTLINNLSSPQQYALLYHFNLGYPFFSPGVEINTGANSVVPKTSSAAKYIDEYKCIPCETRIEEEVFYHLDAKEVVYVTSPIKKKWSLSYDKNHFPYLIEWKSLVEKNYALALEPATSLLDEKLDYKLLAPYESISYQFELKVEDL